MIRRYFDIKDITTRQDANGELILAGYFVVFGANYQITPHVSESVAAGAFDESIRGDVRALYNHNSDIILGRTSSNTLVLTQDAKGLYGEITVNQNDTEAMNAYERIKRGDITGCSFGFDIAAEEMEWIDDEHVHYTITKVDPLYEVSPCVFPAYEATSINARDSESAMAREQNVLEIIERRKNLEAWKADMSKRLRKE